MLLNNQHAEEKLEDRSVSSMIHTPGWIKQQQVQRNMGKRQ